MYAAGHPPLPPFELATFLARMPRHWQDLHQMPKDVQKFRQFEQQPMIALQDVAADLYREGVIPASTRALN